ncbi:MAG: hypothetical protein CK425_08765 [Parachlamydia sp.]|nr:MAG: hypothetical protein CK425_08765 [Parachlamydia sp.]
MSELNSPTSGDAFRQQHYHNHSFHQEKHLPEEPSEIEKVESENVQNKLVVENALTATQEAFNKYIKADAAKEEKLTEAIREEKRNRAHAAAKKKAWEVKKAQRTKLMDKTTQVSSNHIYFHHQA